MTIVRAKPLSDYRVDLAFDDGTTGIVDLSSLAGRGVFAAWLTPGLFEQVKISDSGALEWPGEIDLCPDSLYLKLKQISADELFPLLETESTHA